MAQGKLGESVREAGKGAKVASRRPRGRKLITRSASGGKESNAVVAAAEDPEEYGDPICVCEPEPYWQEVAEELERKANS